MLGMIVGPVVAAEGPAFHGGPPGYGVNIVYDAPAILAPGPGTTGPERFGSERPGRLDVLGLRLSGARRALRGVERHARDPQRVAEANGTVEPQPALKGLMSFDAAGPRFTDCRSGRGYPVAEDGDFEALEHAYLAAGREPGAAILVSFVGSIDAMPGDDGDEPTVFVDRFVGVWLDQTCDQALGDATLTNTEWLIRRLGSAELPADEDGEPKWLLLDGDAQRFTATVGCNQFVGGFDQDETGLRFGSVAATMMACAAPVDTWEAALTGVLDRTAGYRIEGTTLELFDRDGEAIAAFEARYHY